MPISSYYLLQTIDGIGQSNTLRSSFTVTRNTRASSLLHTIDGEGQASTFKARSFVSRGGMTMTVPAVQTTGQLWPMGQTASAAAGLSARQTTTITTASLANNAQETGTVNLSKSYRLLRITTSVAARVRLYSTIAKRNADTARAVGTDPAGDHGVMFDFATEASAVTADLSPVVDGFDGKITPDGVIGYTITNLSGASSVVTATFLWIPSE